MEVSAPKIAGFFRMDFEPGLVTTSNSAGSMWRLDFPALTMPPGNDALGEGGLKLADIWRSC